MCAVGVMVGMVIGVAAAWDLRLTGADGAPDRVHCASGCAPLPGPRCTPPHGPAVGAMARLFSSRKICHLGHDLCLVLAHILRPASLVCQPTTTTGTMPALPRAPATFEADTRLLNNTFEAYRLVSSHDVPLPYSVQATSHRLPLSITLAQLNPPTNTPSLGYKDLKDRFTHEKLVPGSIPGHLAYVDDGSFVVLIVFAPESHRPTFHPLFNLSPPDSYTLRGLPSLHALPRGRWLAADGMNRITLVESKQHGTRWTPQTLDAYTTPQDQHQSSRILAARQQGEVVHVLLQSARKEAAAAAVPGDSKQPPQPSTKTLFDVSLLLLPAPRKGQRQEAPATAQLKWTVTGEEAAYYAMLPSEHQAVLVSEEPFSEGPAPGSGLAAPTSITPQATRPTTPAPAATSRVSNGTTAPPFLWMQTPDSLTVVFQLPPRLTKNDFRVHFSPQGLSLSLANSALDAIKPQTPRIVELSSAGDEGAGSQQAKSPEVLLAKSILAGRYRSRALWAPIDPSSSVWTWEHAGRSDQDRKGLLTLYLEKKDEGTRWTRVFERPATSKRQAAESSNDRRRRPMIGGADSSTRRDDADRLRDAEVDFEEQAQTEHADLNGVVDEDDPPETMDPSELLAMVDSLDKYTAPEGSGFDDDPHPRIDGPDVGFGNRESLLHDQLEPEDATVGKKLRLTNVSTSFQGKEAPSVDTHPESTNLWSLAAPLPETDGPVPLVVRKDLDGLVFLPSDGEDGRGRPRPGPWRHVDTLPALSFVLASKRDLSRVYVRHSPLRGPAASARARRYDSLVLAFESPAPTAQHATSGTGAAHAGNLFVYYGQELSRREGSDELEGSREKYASSRVIRLDAGLGDDEQARSEGSGALMGVAAVRLPFAEADPRREQEEADEVLVCLCERRIIMLRGVL